jgi:hypothetical protein
MCCIGENLNISKNKLQKNLFKISFHAKNVFGKKNLQSFSKVILLAPMLHVLTHSYCVHKIDIIIHVFNHFNCKMMKTSHQNYIQRFKERKICWLNFVLEIMQHLMVL